MMKNKKSQLLLYGVLAGLLGAVIVSIIYTSSKDFNVIGTSSLALIGISKEAESALFYIDQSAKYSAYQSIYELGKNGGAYEKKCGDYFGYDLWSTQNKKIDECFPDYQENFKSFFNKNLNQYASNYPEVYIPADNYEIQLKNKFEIIGLAKSNLEIPIGDIGTEEADEAEISDVEKYQGKKVELKVNPTTTKPGIAVSDKYKLDGYNRPSGATVDTIILHQSGDDAVSKTYNALKKRKLSVHYIVDRDGTIYYLVDESKLTFHAKGWNARSIGIEIVNTGYKSMDYTQAQYNSIKNLVNDIARRWPSIKADDEHVIGHYQASTSGKWDPSPNFDWAKIGLSNHITLLAQNKKAPSEFGYA